MKLGRALTLVLSGTVTAGLVVACVIDLDPPAEPSIDGGALNDQQVVDALQLDASVDARRDTGGVECVQNSDCPTEPGPCVDTTCDLATGRCVYEFCPVMDASACRAQTCDVEAGACVADRDVKFVANELAFTTESAMSGLPCAVAPVNQPANLTRCFAASYPFVFVSHTLSTSPFFAFAYPVADLGVTSPKPIPIEGIDFFPTFVVQSGSQIYFIGKVQMVTSSSGLLPIAWLDAPRDPRTTTMKATKITAQYVASPLVVSAALPVPGGGVLLTSTTNSAIIQAPIADKEMILPIAPQVGTPQGAPVAQSRDRLVLLNHAATGSANGQLVKSAGTTAGNALPAQGITMVIGRSVPGQSMFSQTPEGTVACLTSRWDGDASSPIDGVRISSLIGTNQTIATSPAAGTTLVSFDGGISTATRATGPVAAVDPLRTVALALEPPSATFAQLVEIDDAGVFRPFNPKRREIFDGGPGTFATQTSAGRVYLLQATLNDVSIRIVQPSCDAPPP